MMKSLSDGREMSRPKKSIKSPVCPLHDSAAKREHGMLAPGPHHIRLSSNRHRRWVRKDVDEWIESAWI
jgi:hypothetical protein